VTLIELLELLVKRADFNPEQKADAAVLISQLKAISAFGNIALEIDGKHECVGRYVEGIYSRRTKYRGYWLCKICDRKLGEEDY
jgi:hypothetical protein